jgi:hypothetical protein
MNSGLSVLSLGFLALLCGSCAATTYKGAAYRQTVTTYLEVTSNVPAEVRVGDRVIGITPVSFPYNYEEEVDRQASMANYWQTNPGTAAALTVLSFGTYLPFSFIPAEPTSEARSAGKFLNNKVTLRLSADGYEPLEHFVELQGEAKKALNLVLERAEK